MSNATQQQPPAPQSPVSAKTTNGLGIAALILGILAFIGAFIPILGVGAGFLAFVGLVLGVIGLFLKNKKKGLAIAGTVISGLALILSIVMAIVYAAAFAAGVQAEIEQEGVEANRDVTVVYEVTGTATDASITYATYNEGNSGTQQANGQTLPWTEELTVKAGGDFDFSSFLLTATNGMDSAGDISCKITVDGEVVSEQTSTGQWANVTCSSSGFGGE